MLQAGIWGPIHLYLLQILQTLFQSFQERSLVLLVFIFTVTGLETFITTSVQIDQSLPSSCGKTIRRSLPVRKSMVREHTYNRYINWLDKGQWFDYFAFMMFFPVSPDDFYVRASWFNKDDWRKKFIIIILVFKPFTLAAYTIWPDDLLSTAGHFSIVNKSFLSSQGLFFMLIFLFEDLNTLQEQFH